jgi:hypothetical protein
MDHVSRLEARDDKKVSTLVRYAAALGGRLEVAMLVTIGYLSPPALGALRPGFERIGHETKSAIPRR